MKKSIYVLVCLLSLGIPFSNTGLAEERIQIQPIVDNMFQAVNEDFIYKNSIFLAQSDTVQNLTGHDQSAENQPNQEQLDQNQSDMDQDFLEDYKGEEQIISDPIYFFNYAMYSFNDVLYFYALKPIAKAYKAITPMPLRSGVNNFFHNLLFPVRFINNLLQGKLEAASDEIGIFLVNSTAGVLGFNQVAQKHLNMKTFDEDLGQTLGSYSIGHGFYLVLPVLGPSSLRDALGRVGDSFITPVNYVEPWELSWGMIAYDQINKTSLRIGEYEALKEASLDPYVAIRNAYIQNRRSLIKK